MDKTDTVPVEENEPERSKDAAVKPQGEERRINVKIEEVVEASPDKSLPIIGYFPSGYDPAEKPSSVRVLRGVKRKRRVKVAVKPSESSSNVTFVGTNYSGVPQMCSYRLGVLDKSTNNLTLLPIESDKIFRLEPKFGVHDPTTDLEGENDIPAAAAVEDHQPNFNFSTKKSDQSAKKQMALRAHRDSEAVDDLNSKMAEAKINSKALEEVCAQASSGGRNVPPYDLSATAPHEAYPLKKIILMGHLSDVGELLQQGKYIKTEAYPLFVCNRIHKIQEVKGDKLKERLGIFSYINHLIKFKDKKSKDGPSSEDQQHYYKLPRILSHKFNDMFANTESRWLAGDKKDLLIRYVLVLTLFADDFKTDFSDIARDLRMTAGELRPHFESLGCKFVKENKLTLATLPVPLLFPTGVKSKKRRG